MDKSPDAFRTISEVAIDLDLPQHVLRFWETRFVQIKPLKRGGGRRYYRPDDVDLLKGIRHLLYGEGYTIRGVQRILKEQGVRFVMNLWREGAPQPTATGTPPGGGAYADAEADFDDEFDRGADEEIGDDDAGAPMDDAHSPYAPHHAAPTAPPQAHGADFVVPTPVREEPRFDAPAIGEDAAGVAALAQRFAPRFGPPVEIDPREDPQRPAALPRATPRPIGEDRRAPPVEPPRAVVEPAAAVERVAPVPEAKDAGRPGFGQILDRLRPGGAREAEVPAVRSAQSLSRDEIRRLQSTLFELLECKRLLDQVR